jgi:serine/threonine protein kinase/Tol biopolymer transport system component
MIGKTIAHYRVTEKIGEGGMGEVYRARDTQLGRDVAIKVLPSAFSSDPDRLHRFEQEAQAAGALNHPNILVVYHIGTHDSAPYLVTELLEGKTLRERLDEGAISQRKALEYAVQIAHGLAAAHEKGIVHRDLKPDNLFITNDDRIKILDFGLAKLVQPSGDDIAQTDIATRRVHTDPGTVMGTAGYMSPEQVRGRAVDHRSDIFSFGAVLYEMLAGKRAFRGDSAVETLNAILKEEPPELTTTSPNIAPGLERVVWHCIEKSPERRFQSATDVAFALEALSGQSSSATASIVAPLPYRWSRERLFWIGLSSLLLLGAVLLGLLAYNRPPNSMPVARLTLPLEISRAFRITLSPDGKRVAFLAVNTEGKQNLWVRPLEASSAQALAGTENAQAPFWSADSRLLGYFANGKLYKIDSEGGRPQVICDAPEPYGGTWSAQGVILFNGADGLHRASSEGGAPVLVTKVSAKEEAHRWPYFLPDGRNFVFLADAENTENHNIRVGNLDSQETKILCPAISGVAYANGYLLYVSQGSLVAQTLDPGSLKLGNDSFTLGQPVAEVGENHEFDFSVSTNGVLTYKRGNPNSQLTWFDRTGKKLSTVGPPGNFASISLEPNGQRVAVGALDADGRTGDVWLMDLARGNTSRLTFDPAGDGSPVWAPDGSRIVFASNRGNENGTVDLYDKAANGVGEDHLLFKDDWQKFPTSWSHDGQNILLTAFQKSNSQIWLLSSLNSPKASPLIQNSAFNCIGAQFSPDAHYIAYVSTESGHPEVYVQQFPLSGGKWQVSSGLGWAPLWRADGKELFYQATDGRIMAVEITTGKGFAASQPQQLFKTNIKVSQDYGYAVSADGQRFLINSLIEESGTPPIVMVFNWPSTLKSK